MDETMNARQLRLYELLKPKLEAEPARELVLALGPDSGDVVTKDYLDARLAVVEERLRMFATKDDLHKMSWRLITAMGVWTAIAASLFSWLSRLPG